MIIDGTDYLEWQGEGREVRGEVLEAAGRGDDAREAYEKALDRFERKGNVVAAARVLARIDGLVSDGAVEAPRGIGLYRRGRFDDFPGVRPTE